MNKIKHIKPHVRIRFHRRVNDYPIHNDLFVEVFNKDKQDWIIVDKFNEMSNDYAHTEALELASKL